MITKSAKIGIAGGTLVIGVGGGAGIWGLTSRSNAASINHESEQEHNNPISPDSLSAEEISIGEHGGSSYSGKFGADFKYHLVSTVQGNDTKWKWIYSNVWGKDNENDKADEFKKISDWNSLKEKCEEAYNKDTKTEIRSSSRSSFEQSVWRYCSLGNKKPVTVRGANEDSNYQGQLGQDEEQKLISTTSSDNDWFWEIQEKAFFKQSDNKEGIGSKATDETVFKTLYENKNRGENDTLRKTCESVYHLETYDTSKGTDSKGYGVPNNYTKDALTFCSLQSKPNQNS